MTTKTSSGAVAAGRGKTLAAPANGRATPRPAPNHYRIGTDFERKVIGALTEDGYLVIRAGGSRGHADLVALKKGQVLLIQAKIGGARRTEPGEWNALFYDAHRVGALPLIAWRPRPGVIEYQRITAIKTGIQGARPACQPWTPDEVASHG